MDDRRHSQRGAAARFILRAAAATAWLATLLSCASRPPEPDPDALLGPMLAASFSDRGIATVDRLHQDESDVACSRAMGAPLPAEQANAIQAAAQQTIKPPADGLYLGDWKAGEKLAQDGKGMTWVDKSAATAANGGSCYNCHQISAAEISYGTLGPSLFRYGRTRGVTDPASAAAQPVVVYTWAKLYNSKASNACSSMPRFGHAGLLDENQLKNLMALLLDPKSPVNAP